MRSYHIKERLSKSDPCDRAMQGCLRRILFPSDWKVTENRFWSWYVDQRCLRRQLSYWYLFPLIPSKSWVLDIA
jgi:hypothetical protein